MDSDDFSVDKYHLLGEGATHLIEPLATHLGVFLLLAGSCLHRCRTYPGTPSAAFRVRPA